MKLTLIILILFVAALGAGYYFFVRSFISLWIHALISGAKISLFDLAFIRLQKFSYEQISEIVDLIISASKAGVKIKSREMASHLFAGGDIRRIINNMITAHSADIPLTFDLASAIELAGRDLNEAVKMHVEPSIMETPEVTAISKDGVQLKVRCKVTMRSNVEQFIGGAGKETILARVGTGIVSAIGSSAHHQDIIADPGIISRHIMSIDRDGDNVSDIHQDTAFMVVSIDVASVTTGEDVVAELQARLAEAYQKRDIARAELARAQAITHEKKMEIRVLENKARLMEAEASVPIAIADAIRTGKLSVKKYFSIKNLNADTEMREAIASSVKEPEKDDNK